MSLVRRRRRGDAGEDMGEGFKEGSGQRDKRYSGEYRGPRARMPRGGAAVAKEGIG